VRAKINDSSIAYHDEGNGFPIIWLHAFPLTRLMWAPQAAALASQFRIISIDLRGHGESDGPLRHYSLDHAADDVRGLLDFLSIRQAVFVGLSMGGYVLFAFYRKYAERVAGLVLADTRAQADTDEGKQARCEMAQIASTQGATAIADRMIPKLLSPVMIQTQPELVQRVRRMIEGNPVSGLAGNLLAMAERPDSISLLEQMTCPTHIIVGEWDVPTPPSDAKLMADRIPNACLTIIPGAAHLSNLEQPDLFNETIRAFVANVTR
jgi:3-oxoadipate enol-lactonase